MSPRTAEVILPTSSKMLPTSSTANFLDMSLCGERSPRIGIASQREVYSYEPIRDAGEIQLLSLRPGRPGDMIHADIETVRIRGPRGYDAISYTWADEDGDATKCCNLMIGDDGLLLPITSNCDAVLRRVRKYTDTVWIDAVCINQEDIRERGKQVDLMPHIYMGASRTFAYVGEASNDSDTVLRNLARGIWTPPYLLESFFRRPYFSRVWVVQEVALSSRIIMICGDTAVNWTGFMQNGHLRRIYTRSYYETFPTLFHTDRRHSFRSATVEDALLLGRRCNASDPRDRVFGLMGLAFANERLSADYSMSTAEVYTKMAMYYYKAGIWELDTILGNLCYRNSESRAQVPNLPTWVPDWNQCGPTLLERDPGARRFFEDQDAIFRDNDDTGLYLRGLIVGNLLGILDSLAENKSIVAMYVYWSKSRDPFGRQIPSYRDKSIYVFSTGLGRLAEVDVNVGWRRHRQKLARALSTERFSWIQHIRAFLVARVDDEKSAQTYPSAQWKGADQENLGATASDVPHDFEFVGHVLLWVDVRLDETASEDPLLYAMSTGRTPVRQNERLGQERRDTLYTGGPCTIRIV